MHQVNRGKGLAAERALQRTPGVFERAYRVGGKCGHGRCRGAGETLFVSQSKQGPGARVDHYDFRVRVADHHAVPHLQQGLGEQAVAVRASGRCGGVTIGEQSLEHGIAVQVVQRQRASDPHSGQFLWHFEIVVGGNHDNRVRQCGRVDLLAQLGSVIVR